ncbi:MAG: molybdenum cofactor biosynthesis protein MoaE [Acidimicrobiales bacterium]
MTLPPAGDDWVALSDGPLPLEKLASWPVLPRCGAVVLFAGTVRDHAEGRPGVVSLDYEAYVEAAAEMMCTITNELREQWPALGRVALLHRTGLLMPGEVSVVAAVSAPHRPEAFAAARYGIDNVKARVPIWKRETWGGGQAWGLDAHPLPGGPRVSPARS